MTLAEIRTKANAKLSDFWTALQTRQTAYFNKHGKFFQLLVTNPVVDGADTTFEVIHPNDEKHQVDVNFSFASPIPFQISVDEFVGNDIGYSATVTVELLNGDKYRRTRKATAVIQEAVYDNTDINNPVLVTPKQVTGYTEEDTNWYQVIETVI